MASLYCTFFSIWPTVKQKKCYHVIIMCGCNNSFSSRVGNLPLSRKKPTMKVHIFAFAEKKQWVGSTNILSIP